jgi:hypothetical protein
MVVSPSAIPIIYVVMMAVLAAAAGRAVSVILLPRFQNNAGCHSLAIYWWRIQYCCTSKLRQIGGLFMEIACTITYDHWRAIFASTCTHA